MEKVQEDLVIKILLGLPVKSLVRFRCVSKRWNALIKDPNFISAHANQDRGRAAADHVLVHVGDFNFTQGTVSIYSDIDPPPCPILTDLKVPESQYGLYNILGWHNGIVCFCDGESLILCNPMLRQFKLVPPCSPRVGPGYEVFAEDFGFGFDPSTRDYKIVRMFQMSPAGGDDEYEEGTKVEIYNLSTDSWRRIAATLPRRRIEPLMWDTGPTQEDVECWPGRPSPGFQLFFNGTFHYLLLPPFPLGILCFHFSTEVFTTMDFPRDAEMPRASSALWAMVSGESDADYILRVLNECLALVRTSVFGIDIWVMKEYGVEDSWSKQYAIRCDDYTILFHRPETIRGGTLLTWKNVITPSNWQQQLISIELETGRIKESGIFFGQGGFVEVVDYKESLISVLADRE